MTSDASAAASSIEHWRRRMSLATGCVLFLFLITHLLNHALGLASLAAMDAGRFWFLGFWRSVPGSVLFYSSLILHTVLAMYGLFNRRSLRMPLWEAAQIIFGLSIPLFMISHVVGTRLAHEWFGTVDSYARIMFLYWELSPDVGLKQTIFLLIAWTHACVGLHYWLRLKPWYTRWFPACLAVMTLVAALSLAGFSQGGREAARLSTDRGIGGARCWPATGCRTARRGENSTPRATPCGGAIWVCSGWCSSRAGRAARRSGGERRFGSPMRAGAKPSLRWAPPCWRRAAPPAFRTPPYAGDAGGAPPAG